jgi:5-methylcytosine-specific restriction protein A
MSDGRKQRYRKQVRMRDKHQCQECGEDENLEVHHIKPLYRGGIDDPSNMITLCEQCHLDKHNRYGPTGNKSIQIPVGKKLCAECFLVFVDMEVDKCPKCHNKIFHAGSIYEYPA